MYFLGFILFFLYWFLQFILILFLNCLYCYLCLYWLLLITVHIFLLLCMADSFWKSNILKFKCLGVRYFCSSIDILELHFFYLEISWFIWSFFQALLDAIRWLSGKEIYLQCRRYGFDPWVRKIPYRRKWERLQYSCLENPMERRAWQAEIHRVTKS